jgi:hypothetical protein
MVSKKFSIIFICLLCVGYCASAQQKISKKHFLKANLTISPGFLLEQKVTNLYLHGHLEYYPEEKISLRGDSYLYLDSQQEELFSQHHSLFLGGFYHFLKGKADPFVGFQPGMSISQLPGVATEEKTAVLPLLSVIAGMNYFVSKYFNFFASARYLKGTYQQSTFPFAVDEIRFSAGLGFNLPLQNSKSYH